MLGNSTIIFELTIYPKRSNLTQGATIVWRAVQEVSIMDSVTANAFEILRWVVVACVVMYVWFLFFRIRFLEKDIQEERKSLIAQSCVAPLCITITTIFGFGISFTSELQEGNASIVWVLLMSLSMVLSLVLVVTHARTVKK